MKMIRTLVSLHSRTYLPIGEEKVLINKEEINKIKEFGNPSLKLLGFKPKSYIKPYYNNRSSYFLYPNNKRVLNSGKFFHAFIEQLLKYKMVAIVRFIPKQNSRVRFGALFAQKE